MNLSHFASAQRARSRFRPSLESLENRLALACSVTTNIDFDLDGATDIRITGNKKVQILAIADDGEDVIVRLDCNGDGDATDPGELNNAVFGDFGTYDFNLKGGGDTLTYRMADDFGFVESNKFHFNLGGGSDSFTFNFDLFGLKSNCHFSLELLAGGGNDSVTFERFGAFDGSARFQAVADLGKGNDDFRTLFNEKGLDLNDSNLLSIAASAGPGNDSLAVATSGGVDDGEIAIQNTAILDLALNGDAGHDLISVRFEDPQADLDGRLAIDTDGGTGNDTISVRADLFQATLGSNGTLDIDILGNVGDDILSVQVDSDPQVGYTADGIILNADDGTDDCNATTADVPSGTVHQTSCET